jgi:hypothetical protein
MTSGLMPVSWDFAISGVTATSGLVQWRILLYGLNDPVTDDSAYRETVKNTWDATGEVFGFGSYSGSSSGLIPLMTGDIQVSFEVWCSEACTVTIPDHSIDLNVTGSTATPEPASVVLIPLGAGAMLLLRRRVARG